MTLQNAVSLSLLGTIAFLFWQDAKKRRREEMAAQHHEDMGRLYHELLDDPAISSEKWRGWLPLFEYADRLFAAAHPYIRDFARYGELVRSQIDDHPYQKAGSSRR